MMILRVINGPDKGRTYEFPEDEARVLGRGESTDSLSDTTCSRRHIELISRDGQWYVNDLGSTNGTFINGQRIEGEVQINVRDHVQIGCTLMVATLASMDETIASNVAVVRPELDYRGDDHAGEDDVVAAGMPQQSQTNLPMDPRRMLQPGASGAHMPIVPYQQGMYMPAPQSRPISIIQWILILITVLVVLAIVCDVYLSHRRLLESLITQTKHNEERLDEIHEQALAKSQGQAKHLDQLIEQVNQVLQSQTNVSSTVSAQNDKVLTQILKAIQSQPKVQEQRLIEEIRSATKTESPANSTPILEQILAAIESQSQEPAKATDQSEILVQILEELKAQREAIVRPPIPTVRSTQASDGSAGPNDSLVDAMATDTDSQSTPSLAASTDIDEAPTIEEEPTSEQQTPIASGEQITGYDRVVFLVDASGSLIDSMPRVIQELNHSIEQLESHQSFSVLVFHDDQVLEPSPAGLKRASEKVKRQIEAWAEPSAGHVIPTGSSNPIQALELAMSYSPSLIYLYSDTITGTRPEEIQHDRLLAVINDLNSDQNVTISTVQFFYSDPDETLKTIAMQNGGWYRFIRELQPVPVPSLEDFDTAPGSSHGNAAGNDANNGQPIDQVVVDELINLLDD